MINEQSGYVKKTREPGDNENKMQGFDIVVQRISDFPSPQKNRSRQVLFSFKVN